MSIFYNIVLKDRTRIPVRYACFGALNNVLGFGREYVDRGSEYFKNQFTEVDSSRRQIKFRSHLNSTNQLSAIEFDYKRSFLDEYSEEIWNTAKHRFLNYIKQFAESFPFVGEILSIKPEKCLIRVTIAGVPCDKALFALSVSRNLLFLLGRSSMNSNWESSMVGKVELLIPDFKKRILFLSIFEPFSQNDWETGETTLSAKPKFNSEYNLLNPATLGKKGLRQIYQSENDIEWFQPNFDESERGYKRESHFKADRVYFSGVNLDRFSDRDLGSSVKSITYIQNRYSSTDLCSGLLGRKLFDCFSVVDDEPLLSSSRWDEFAGFVWNPTTPEHERRSAYPLTELVPLFLEILEDNPDE